MVTVTNYFEKELYINPSLADADGLLSRYETFNIFMDIADDHAGSMGVAWRDISPRNLFWLTVKTKIVFEDRPKLGDTVTLATWVEEPTKLRGDRNYEMRMGDKVLVRGRTEWAVLNTETMKLIPISEVYPEGLDYSRPSACPEGFARIRDRFDAADKYAEYTVRSTDIDVGHHMNNAKYVLRRHLPQLRLRGRCTGLLPAARRDRPRHPGRPGVGRHDGPAGPHGIRKNKRPPPSGGGQIAFSIRTQRNVPSKGMSSPVST